MQRTCSEGKTPIGDSMNRNRVHHVVLASTVVLILLGCSLPKRPEHSPSTLVPMAIAPRADLTPSGLGNAYDGQPELLASCAKWQGPGVYAGCARRIAKVSLVPEAEAPPELYTSVADFKRNALDADHMLDSFMRDGIEPRLRTGANSDRHPSERRNVAIDVLLYAVKHEPDNDYHLIVGDPDCRKSECFFNVEVSGLPVASHPDFDALKAAQSGFEAFTLTPPWTVATTTGTSLLARACRVRCSMTSATPRETSGPMGCALGPPGRSIRSEPSKSGRNDHGN